MEEFLGTIKNDSCCPNLSLKERIVGFTICFIIGMVLLIMSITSIFGVFIGNTMAFGLLYTCGNLLIIAS